MNTTEESKERILSNHFFSVKNLTMDGMWVVLLFISGLFKIPSPIPGTEFQLSAPLAISIGRIRGFLHYLTIGIIASIIGMILGLQTIYNVIIAMVYRIVAGLILTVLKKEPTGPHYCWSCRNVCSQTGIGNNLGCCLAAFSSKRSSWNDLYCNNCPCSDFNSKKSP